MIIETKVSQMNKNETNESSWSPMNQPFIFNVISKDSTLMILINFKICTKKMWKNALKPLKNGQIYKAINALVLYHIRVLFLYNS